MIFVHGCFWHRHDCRYFKWPASNAEFWRNKIEGNVLRDQKNFSVLAASDWVYLIVWECIFRDVKKADLFETLEKIGCVVEQFLAPDNNECMEINVDGTLILNTPFEATDE